MRSTGAKVSATASDRQSSLPYAHVPNLADSIEFAALGRSVVALVLKEERFT